MKLTYGLLFSLLVSIIPVTTADAQYSKGTYTFEFENDRIANTDRHYTAGFRFSWVSEPKEDDPAWVRDILTELYPFADLREGRVGLSFGQSMFTPENTQTTALVRDDRPYVGWLYGGISVHAETKSIQPTPGPDVLDTVELDIGVVGPAAFGEQVQNTVHRLIGVATAKGWNNQLDNEPGIMLIGERKWRTNPVRALGLEFDAIPHVGGSLGNIMTFANAGATLRFGQDLDVDYGPPRIQPSLSGLGAIERDRGFAWYVFAGAEGRIVARNIFLDGNTFSSSHSVDREIFVGDAQFGIAAIYEGVRFAFTQVYRTKEFEGQSQADRFGAISLSVRF